MPLNLNLNVSFTAPQEAAIDTALDTILATINAAVPDPLNLDTNERQGIRTISNTRYPYVARAIGEFGPLYTNLNSIDVQLAKAQNNLAFFNQLANKENRLLELLDRITDLKINSGYIAMKFTDDQYDNAKHYKSRNVAGAGTVYEAQNPLYDRESNPDVTEPTP